MSFCMCFSDEIQPNDAQKSVFRGTILPVHYTYSFWGLCPQTPTGALPWDPAGGDTHMGTALGSLWGTSVPQTTSSPITPLSDCILYKSLVVSVKCCQLQGTSPLTSWPGALPLDPTGGTVPRPSLQSSTSVPVFVCGPTVQISCVPLGYTVTSSPLTCHLASLVKKFISFTSSTEQLYSSTWVTYLIE